MDKKNASALIGSEYDAIIYKIGDKPHEIQLSAKQASRIEKVATYDTTPWSTAGSNMAEAMFTGGFDKNPKDYKRLDSRFDSISYDGYLNEEFRYFLCDWKRERMDEDPDSWITLENGEHVPLDKSGKAIGGAGGWAEGKDFSGAGESDRYTGSLEIGYQKISQETMDNKLRELRSNQKKGEAPVTSEKLESMARSLVNYGCGSEAAYMCATQSPEIYKEYMSVFPKNEEEMKGYAKQANDIEDFLRLSNKYDKPVYRAYGFITDTPEHRKEAEDFIKRIKPGAEIDMKHISSWAKHKGTAENYADGPIEFSLDEGLESYSVMYHLNKPKSVVDIGDIKPAEGEALSPSKMRLRIKSVKKSYNEEYLNHRIDVEVEEI